MAFSYPQDFNPQDQRLIALWSLAYPQDDYTKERRRKTGFVNRMHRALYVLRRYPKGVRHRQYASGRWYHEVYSQTHPEKPHQVQIIMTEKDKGKHQCSCYDSLRPGHCAHILMVSVAESEGLVVEWTPEMGDTFEPVEEVAF